MQKVSWFKLMWSNSYIQLFLVGFIGTILMIHYKDRFDFIGDWLIGTSILALVCIVISYFGFYKFWKTYNAEADRINANKIQRETEETIKQEKAQKLKVNNLVLLCSFHQDYQVVLLNQWCPYCGRVIQEPIEVISTDELDARTKLFSEHCTDYIDALTKVSYYESLAQLPDGVDLDEIKKRVRNYQFGWKAEIEHRS